MSSKPKHRRSNRERWDRAWNMVQFWYSEQSREGAVTYTVGGHKVSVGLQDGSSRDTLAQAKKDRPENWRHRYAQTQEDADRLALGIVTADGREDRRLSAEEARRGFWGAPTDVEIRRQDGTTHQVPLEPRINYARQAMRMVARLSGEARAVLEMRAATWDWPAIADEMRCAEPTCRQYLSEGLGVLMCYQEAYKPNENAPDVSG